MGDLQSSQERLRIFNPLMTDLDFWIFLDWIEDFFTFVHNLSPLYDNVSRLVHSSFTQHNEPNLHSSRSHRHSFLSSFMDTNNIYSFEFRNHHSTVPKSQSDQGLSSVTRSHCSLRGKDGDGGEG